MVGRISVQVDAAEEADRSTALWGWFECDDDPLVARALFSAAASWAVEEGASQMLGPASFTALEEVGLLVEGYDEPASFLSPWHPPRYAELVEGCGGVGDGELATLRVDLGADGRSVNATPSLRSVERALLERAGSLLAPVGGHPAGWDPTLAEVRARFRRLRPATERTLAVVGDAGVALAVRDLNEVLGRLREKLGPRGAIRLLAAARRARQGAVLAFLGGDPGRLLAPLAASAAGAGYRHLEATVGSRAAPVLGALEELGAQEVRRYRTYRMEL